jgi:hypothetical protein
MPFTKWTPLCTTVIAEKKNMVNSGIEPARPLAKPKALTTTPHGLHLSPLLNLIYTLPTGLPPTRNVLLHFKVTEI